MLKCQSNHNKENIVINTSVHVFEERVFELELIRVVLRAKKFTDVPSYHFIKKLPENKFIKHLGDRIKACIGPDIEFMFVCGNGNSPHPLTSLQKIRNSYI